MPPKKPTARKVPVRSAAPEPGPIEETPARPTARRSPPPEPVARPPLRLYRHIAVSFVVLVALILLAVLYVSTVQATIRVRPVAEVVKANLLLDVVKIPTQPTEVRGRVVSGTLGKSETFAANGEGAKQAEGTARGTITVKNSSGTSQALVVNTRFLSKEGVLFRLDQAVTVPANGSVQAKAHADKPGVSGDIAPTTFTIPGLNESRQKQVTGESTAAFTGGVRMVKAISQEEINAAVAKLKGTLEEDAKAMLRETVNHLYTGEVFQTEVTQEKASVDPGIEADNFSVDMTVKVSGVFFDKKTVEDLAVARLYQSLGAGRTFAAINFQSLQTSADKVDLAGEQASIQVYLDGRAVPSAASQALDPARFVGKSGAEVKSMLVVEGVALDVQVELSPFWVRRVPRLKDHIYIEIE